MRLSFFLKRGEISESFILVGNIELEIHRLKTLDREKQMIGADIFKNDAETPSWPVDFLMFSLDK